MRADRKQAAPVGDWLCCAAVAAAALGGYAFILWLASLHLGRL
jgi:hypothetical protein